MKKLIYILFFLFSFANVFSQEVVLLDDDINVFEFASYSELILSDGGRVKTELKISNYDVGPEFHGNGSVSMHNFVFDKLSKIRDTSATYSQCTVIVEMIIDQKGKIHSPQVYDSGTVKCEQCKEDAIKVVKMMPKWDPAKLKGKPVNSWFYIDIRFR